MIRGDVGVGELLTEIEVALGDQNVLREEPVAYGRKESPLRKKSFQWALETAKRMRPYYTDEFERHFAHQVMRSATAVAAAVEEANAAASNNQFIYKIRHALQEANESKLWLSLIAGLGFSDDATVQRILAEGNEVRYLLAAIIKTFRERHPDI